MIDIEMSRNNDLQNQFRKNICNEIFAVDKNIRFVGIVNSEGEVIEGGFRKGIEPLLDQNEEQDMYLQSLSNISFFQSFSEKFGSVDYLMIRQKKITMITFPYRGEIICISASSQSDIDRIRDETVKIILL
ncbi:hypothetical protein NARC_40218 [Candidatus Nitrosocosmicus arcticus]|uniref:Roadblock/LAMTOR2 domain-containing protein n=2 Tax=Candidatus Nitrosocosmicus arcticus TaxID=2035267 RepID=A0A557SXC4_9ARCH|nr:hypothetical protein NARC_40218 [Candidatus Nitrosocosmicus arcticus]